MRRRAYATVCLSYRPDTADRSVRRRERMKRERDIERKENTAENRRALGSCINIITISILPRDTDFSR